MIIALTQLLHENEGIIIVGLFHKPDLFSLNGSIGIFFLKKYLIAFDSVLASCHSGNAVYLVCQIKKIDKKKKIGNKDMEEVMGCLL